MKLMEFFITWLIRINRQFEFCLEPGTVITFDNWRLLHARSALDWLSPTLWWIS